MLDVARFATARFRSFSATAPSRSRLVPSRARKQAVVPMERIHAVKEYFRSDLDLSVPTVCTDTIPADNPICTERHLSWISVCFRGQFKSESAHKRFRDKQSQAFAYSHPGQVGRNLRGFTCVADANYTSNIRNRLSRMEACGATALRASSLVVTAGSCLVTCSVMTTGPKNTNAGALRPRRYESHSPGIFSARSVCGRPCRYQLERNPAGPWWPVPAHRSEPARRRTCRSG